MQTKRFKKRFFYIANIFDDAVKSQRRITTDSPAASRKVLTLCRAVRKAGGDACVISLGRGGCKSSWKTFSATIKRIDRVPVIFLVYWDIPFLTHIVSLISLFSTTFRVISRANAFIFYNYTIHYVLALITAKLLGSKCILDIEDGYRSDDASLRSKLNGALLSLHNRLCAGGTMVASTALLQQTSTSNTMVCYGVATATEGMRDWNDEQFQVLFSGSLLEDTGAALFLEALSIMAREYPDKISKFRFIVTGFGDYAHRIHHAAIDEMKQFLCFRGSISASEYRELLMQSHIGFCLKLPTRSMGSTTFPSKVVELASSGLLLVSTQVSDVPLIFDNSSAFLLEEATPLSLVNTLICIANNPKDAQKIAFYGSSRISSLLSEAKVGVELLHFWQGSSAS